MTAARRLSRRVTAETTRLLDAGVRTRFAARLAAQAWVAQHSQPHRLRRLEHGTERGWRQHHTDQTDPCQACLDAHAEHNRPTRRAA